MFFSSRIVLREDLSWVSNKTWFKPNELPNAKDIAHRHIVETMP